MGQGGGGAASRAYGRRGAAGKRFEGISDRASGVDATGGAADRIGAGDAADSTDECCAVGICGPRVAGVAFSGRHEVAATKSADKECVTGAKDNTG